MSYEVGNTGNSTGSVLINDRTLGAGIKELKPGAAAPLIKTQFATGQKFGNPVLYRGKLFKLKGQCTL